MYFSELEKALKNRDDIRIDKIKEAYDFAKKAHHGQMRKSGEEYITHPVEVAKILLDIGGDEESIIAALLHDTVEDTEVTHKQVEKKFGKEVGILVDGMTKLPKDAFDDNNEKDVKIETVRKWMEAMQKDIRVAVIKIADRIHNLETLDVCSDKKKLRIAQETLNIYVRFARWLSLRDIRIRMEKLSLPYVLKSETYQKLESCISERDEKGKNIIQVLNTALKNENSHLNIDIHLTPLSPQKSYFLLEHDRPLSEVFPITISCITDNQEECYKALSFFHRNWKRKNQSFQDLINIPDVIGRRWVETIILLENDEQVRVRIMTPKMYEFYYKGISSFCFSSGKKDFNLPWINKMNHLIKTSKDKSYEFWNSIESDLLEGFVILHGPQNSILSLPENSTALDAAIAYAKTNFSKIDKISINGEEVSFQKQIKGGDRIGIEFNKNSYVHYDWLRCVENISSIDAIKKALREKGKQEKIEKGRELLQEEFNRNDLGIFDEVSEKRVLRSCRDLGVSSFNDLLQKVGEVYISPGEVVQRFSPDAVKIKKKGNDEGIEIEVKRTNTPSVLEEVFKGIEHHSEGFIHKKTITNDKGDTAFDKFLVFARDAQQISILLDYLQKIRKVRSAKRIFLSHKIKGYASITTFAILMGCYSLFIRYLGEEGISASISAPVRLFSGSITLFLIAFFLYFFSHKKFIIPQINKWFLLGAASLGVSAFLFHKGLESTHATIALLFENVSAILIILYLWATNLHQKKIFLQIKGSIFFSFFTSVVGISLLFFFSQENIWGNIILLFNMLFFSLFLFFSSKYAIEQKQHSSNIILTAFTLLGAVITILPVTDFEGIITLPPFYLYSSIFLGVIASAFAYTLLISASRHISSFIISLFIILSVLIALAGEISFFNFHLNIFFFFGFCFLVIASLTLGSINIKKLLKNLKNKESL